METASLELCKELYELSGWDNVSDLWNGYEIKEALNIPMEYIPKYDLGFLLRKLPHLIEIDGKKCYLCMEALFGAATMSGDGWNVGYLYHSTYQIEVIDVEPIEDAVAELAIELFKQGVLTKEV